MPALQFDCPDKAFRIAICDECPTMMFVDANYDHAPYELMIEDTATGYVRGIRSFIAVAEAAANFAGIAERIVTRGSEAHPGGVSTSARVPIFKCVDMDVDLIETPTVTPAVSVANPVYLIPWLDPDTGSLSTRVFDTSLSDTNAVGVIKQLCGDGGRTRPTVCPPGDAPDAGGTGTSPLEVPDRCPITTVRGSFRSKLAGC